MSMEDTNLSLKVIAYIRTDFPEKFGIPRQSGLAATRGEIIFEQEYRHPEALRGLEAYSYIWLIWGFSRSCRKDGRLRSGRRDWEVTGGWGYLPPGRPFARIHWGYPV